MTAKYPHPLLCACMLILGCAEDAAREPRDISEDAGFADAALDTVIQEDAAAALDATLADAMSVDAAPPYVPPQVVFPSEPPTRPFLLSEVGLYTDIASKTLAPDLIPYEPQYALWSDGAEKVRHLRMPAGTRIDNEDPDHWQFPVGTMLFKEFRNADARLETRVIARTGPGVRDYFFGAFAWRDDESDAELVWDGALDVRGTQHDVPNTKQCGTCHNGEPGRVLGVSAVQTAGLQTSLLRVQRTPYQVPGDAVAREALGYLHANCGHCHNPSGSARPDTDLFLRLSVASSTVEDSIPYVSSVGVKLQYFQGSLLTQRIVAGDADQSGVYYRMTQRGPRTQMPPIATERVDEVGMSKVAAFIAGIEHDAGL
jgi:hypothetical protein